MLDAGEETPTLGKQVQNRNKVMITTIVAVSLIVAAQAWALWESYNATRRLEKVSSENALRTVVSNIQRNFEQIELSLKGLASAAADPAVLALPPNIQNRVLFDNSAGARDLGPMLVINANGEIVFDSASSPPRVANVADRDYFIAEIDKDAGTFVSALFTSRISDGETVIALSRRIIDADGRFAGVAVASIRVDYFTNLFGQIKFGSGSIISLTRTDGTTLYQFPSLGRRGRAGEYVDENSVLSMSIVNTLNDKPDRYAEVDGVNRRYVYALIPGYPLILSLGVKHSHVMRGWYRQSIISTLILFVTLGIVIFTIRSLQVALARSKEVEAEFERLSLTDALTNVPNRRAFDLVLATEKRRAIRNKSDLSLAMVDIDHFKRVNDRFGHQAGDKVLENVAGAILASVRRPGDYVARYGGEEFIIILPATSEDGALFLAERIRRQVEAIVTRLGQPDVIRVTVSIGVASLSDRAEVSIERLIQEADEAMYQAKSRGRNQVAIFKNREEEDEMKGAVSGWIPVNVLKSGADRPSPAS